MKVYYAHSMHLYGSQQEKRDLHTLKSLGFEVINPSDKIHEDKCNEIRGKLSQEVGGLYTYDMGSEAIMRYFMEIVDSCDALAFRAHIDGKIPSGVGAELLRAKMKDKPIIELPSLINSKFMEKGETRQYLELNGQR